MRKRFNTVICNLADQTARLAWFEDGDVFEVADGEEPFTIMLNGEIIDVEIAVEHDVREFALRERQN